jgi:hypothetical protein
MEWLPENGEFDIKLHTLRRLHVYLSQTHEDTHASSVWGPKCANGVVQ